MLSFTRSCRHLATQPCSAFSYATVAGPKRPARASPVERAFIRASHHGFLKGRGGDEAREHREEEIAEYQALLELEPSHFWAGGNLVWALEGQGRGREAAELAAWPALVSPQALLIAVAFSGAIGIVFGYFPAQRAARMDPIVCLRSE